MARAGFTPKSAGEPTGRMFSQVMDWLEPFMGPGNPPVNMALRGAGKVVDALTGPENPPVHYAAQAMEFANKADPMGLMSMGNPIAMTAFHGSPHVFDKFSMSKIGTGEGAQAYGHGLYFTSEPKVAEQYRRNLTPSKHAGTIYFGDTRMTDYYTKHGITGNSIAGDVLNDLRTAIMGNADAAKGLAEVRANYAKYLTPDTFEFHPTLADNAKRSMAFLDGLEKEGIRYDQMPGSFHQVDIPDDLLAFDQPIGQQPQPVQDALAKVAPGRPGLAYKGQAIRRLDRNHNPERRALFHQLRTWEEDPEKFRAYVEGIRESSPLGREGRAQLAEMDRLISEGKLARTVLPWDDFSTGRSVYESLGDPRQASAKLAEAGIPGHSYIGDSSGVRNFVIYDDAAIKPMGRWSSLQEFLASQEKP